MHTYVHMCVVTFVGRSSVSSVSGWRRKPRSYFLSFECTLLRYVFEIVTAKEHVSHPVKCRENHNRIRQKPNSIILRYLLDKKNHHRQ